jgi:hypothetical protein
MPRTRISAVTTQAAATRRKNGSLSMSSPVLIAPEADI